ncbi:hypothetical protein J6590_089936 [Homalodisca vitripennis]|nr:hypothetical protein J6590_089936 [Homalodisca vitripennis]
MAARSRLLPPTPPSPTWREPKQSGGNQKNGGKQKNNYVDDRPTDVSTRPQPYRRQSVHTNGTADVLSRGQWFGFLRMPTSRPSNDERISLQSASDIRRLWSQGVSSRRWSMSQSMSLSSTLRVEIDTKAPMLHSMGACVCKTKKRSSPFPVLGQNDEKTKIKYLKEMVQHQFPYPLPCHIHLWLSCRRLKSKENKQVSYYYNNNNYYYYTFPERASNAWTGRSLVGESPTHQGKHLFLTVHNAFSYRKENFYLYR